MSFSLKIKTAEQLAEEAREALKERVRQRRDLAIEAGITVGGVPVYTDNISQLRIIGAAKAVERHPGRRINWKTAGAGFMELGAQEILAVADAVLDHVQACFDREAALVDQIEAGGKPDIEAGWPGS